MREDIEGAHIAKVEVDEPLWKITYQKGQEIIIIELVFDVVMQRVQIRTINKSVTVIQSTGS